MTEGASRSGGTEDDNVSYDVVIPACNEAATIAHVVRQALLARGCGEVIVIDDHSTDDTARVSEEAGARVIRSLGRRSKAQALATGVAASSRDVLVFFDADIFGVEPAHIESLAAPLLCGEWQMCCGLIDYGPLKSPLFLRLPPITGMRGIRREIFEAIPESKLNGFQIEIMINEVIARGRMPTAIRLLPGTSHRSKIDKEGWRRGLKSHLAMTLELLSCFRFIPLWTYWTYLQNLDILPVDRNEGLPCEGEVRPA